MNKIDIKRILVWSGLLVIFCAMTLSSAAWIPLESGQKYQFFTSNIENFDAGNPAASSNTLLVKSSSAFPWWSESSLGNDKIILQPNYPQYLVTVVMYNPIIFNKSIYSIPSSATSSVPQQGLGVSTASGTSGSAMGGLVILGYEGDWISIRSNFYNPSMGIYDGRWHIDVGTTPAYWENVVLPGSYTIKIARDTDLDGVYYCETVTVLAGQITTIQAGSGICPLCSDC
jgi:hypothetical protein